MAEQRVNETAVGVTTEISFHEVLNALDLFSDKYPTERLDIEQIRRIQRAALLLEMRLLAASEQTKAFRTVMINLEEIEREVLGAGCLPPKIKLHPITERVLRTY